MKRLAHEVAMYIGKKQRDRYYQVIECFTQKYEKLYNVNNVKPQAVPSAAKYL